MTADKINAFFISFLCVERVAVTITPEVEAKKYVQMFLAGANIFWSQIVEKSICISHLERNPALSFFQKLDKLLIIAYLKLMHNRCRNKADSR